jgi:hypothetical protein
LSQYEKEGVNHKDAKVAKGNEAKEKPQRRGGTERNEEE